MLRARRGGLLCLLCGEPRRVGGRVLLPLLLLCVQVAGTSGRQFRGRLLPRPLRRTLGGTLERLRAQLLQEYDRKSYFDTEGRFRPPRVPLMVREFGAFDPLDQADILQLERKMVEARRKRHADETRGQHAQFGEEAEDEKD